MPGSLQEELRSRYVICSCEGAAERTIISLLLEKEKLCFGSENLVDHQVRENTKD